MKVALCGTPSTEEGWNQVWELIGQLREQEISVYGSLDLRWAFSHHRRDTATPFPVGTLHPMAARHLPLAADLLVLFGGQDALLRRLRPISRHGPTVLLVGTSEVFPAVAESSFKEGVERILKGKNVLEARMLLGACLSGADLQADQKGRSGDSVRPKDSKSEEYFVGAGEVVFQRSAKDTLLRLDLTADGHFLTRYEADGLIISSPTGSLARSLSAGGPYVVPGTEAFLVTPVASHTLTTRPVLVPDTAKLEVRVGSRGGSAHLRVDRRARILKDGALVTVRRAASDLRLAGPATQKPENRRRGHPGALARFADEKAGEEMKKRSPTSTEPTERRAFSFPQNQSARTIFELIDSVPQVDL